MGCAAGFAQGVSHQRDRQEPHQGSRRRSNTAESASWDHRRRRDAAASSPPSSGVTRSAGHPAYQITNGLHTSLPASQLSHQEINNIRAAANGCQARFTCQGIRINC